MLTRCVQVLFFNTLLLSGCTGEHDSSTAQRDTTATALSRSDQRTLDYRSDSLAQARFHRSLMHFFDQLIDETNLGPDTSWLHPLYTETHIEDEFIMRPRWGDLPDDFVDFPFNDLHMSYWAGKPKDYFLINGQRVPETVYAGDNRFPVSSIHRFRYQSRDYLVFTGGLRDYNGYGDRIHFNYFFDLSGSRPVADMYENYWGYVYEPFLYGELDNDPYLDRIKFDGIGRPSFQEFDTITIVAETYRHREWEPLRDGAGKPYTIELLLNEEENIIRLGAANWMRPVTID